MINHEFPSSDFYEKVTSLCECLSKPCLHPAVKQKVLTQLEAVLEMRVAYLKAKGLISECSSSIKPKLPSPSDTYTPIIIWDEDLDFRGRRSMES